MITSDCTVDSLVRERPEWTPWLGVVAEARDAIRDTAWEESVPHARAPADGMPRLARAHVSIDPLRIERTFTALVERAIKGRLPKFASVHGAPDACGIFRAALNGDEAALGRHARQAGVDADAFAAVAALLPMPFLHACGRRWGSTLETWSAGYCPTCGAWPAFAEARGVERTRHLRCGRCGAEWRSHAPLCVYCGNTDHEALAALVVENGSGETKIEICNSCRGYLKVYTTLRGCAGADVMVRDLASAELDIAALSRGYTRPRGAGHALEIAVDPHAA